MSTGEKVVRKTAYFGKLINLVESAHQTLIVKVDHVDSKSMQNIRMALRGKATLLMGNFFFLF